MRRFLLLSLGCCYALPAHASVNENFCFRWPIAFDDQDATLGDDYLTTETSIPARGARVKITRSDSTVVFDGYVNEGDTDPGCTGVLSLNQFFTYTLQINSKAFVNDNVLESYDDDSTPAERSHLWVGTTIAGGTLTRTTPLHQQWSTIAAMSWAMYRRNAGMTGLTMNAYNQTCPGTGQLGACCDEEQMYVPINRKYQIVDVMGECIAERLNEGNPSDGPTDMAEEPCEGITTSSHEMISKEVNKASAWFGFAHYYAAVAFNQTDEASCKFFYWYSQDWDRDKVGDFNSKKVNCADGMSSWGVDSYNYEEDYCEEFGVTYVRNVATEYDWLRFWWDMDQVEGLSTANIATIVDEANMHTCDDDLPWTDEDACASRLVGASTDGGWGWNYAYQVMDGHEFAMGS